MGQCWITGAAVQTRNIWGGVFFFFFLSSTPLTRAYRRGQSSLSQCGCTGKMSKTRSLVLKPRGITFDVHLQRDPRSFAVFSCSSLMNTKYRSRPRSDRTFPKMKCAVDVAETWCTAAGRDPTECPLRIGLNWCGDVFFMSIYLISSNYNSIWRKWNTFLRKKIMHRTLKGRHGRR